MSASIEAAIIDTLMDHTGGAYKAGAAVSISADNTIGVKFNTGTMELVNGELSARIQSGAGGGGVQYAAGNAIDLSNNTIGVKFNTGTMELINGELSAKVQSGEGGTGVQYAAGSAIDLTNNTIAVKYDTNTMELKDGKLAAKAQSGSTSPTYQAGSAIDLTNNTIAVKFNPDTMELVNGQLSARAAASAEGGNVPITDTFVRNTSQTVRVNSSGDTWCVYISGLNSTNVLTGNLMKIRMKGGDILEFLIIANSDDELHGELIGEEHNCILLSKTSDTIFHARWGSLGGFAGKTFAIVVGGGSVDEDQTGDDVGLFEMTQMSYKTLVRLLQHYNRIV